MTRVVTSSITGYKVDYLPEKDRAHYIYWLKVQCNNDDSSLEMRIGIRYIMMHTYQHPLKLLCVGHILCFPPHGGISICYLFS